MAVMAREWRADAEGSQFQERWEAEYFSVETVCFIYHPSLLSTYGGIRNIIMLRHVLEIICIYIEFVHLCTCLFVFVFTFVKMTKFSWSELPSGTWL